MRDAVLTGEQLLLIVSLPRSTSPGMLTIIFWACRVFLPAYIIVALKPTSSTADIRSSPEADAPQIYASLD